MSLKNSKRYAATGGWSYYNFNHEPKVPTAKQKPKDECGCGAARARGDKEDGAHGWSAPGKVDG